LPDALDEALIALEEGRLGPVWLEVPLDVQNSPVPANWDRRDASVSRVIPVFDLKILECTALLSQSSRPLIVAGNGVHLSGAEPQLRLLAEEWGIPVVTTWSASDIFSFQNEHYVGNLGILGQRAANRAVQQADLLLILGTRLSIPCIGYATEKFAPSATKIMVDIDPNEIMKQTLATIDIPIVADVAEFLTSLLLSSWDPRDIAPWQKYLREIKNVLRLDKEEKADEEGFVDSYSFIEALSGQLVNEIIVTDMGTSFTCTMQALKCNGKNRLFTSSGLSSMGFGLPGAIGAWVANRGPVICIAGDGGFLMNVQELQTIVDNKVNIKIFVLDSNGYLAISIMQDNSFHGRRFGSDPASGVGSPDFLKVSEAFGIPAIKLEGALPNLESQIRKVLDSDGPVLCVVPLSPRQKMRPRVMSLKNQVTGQFESPSLENMWPELAVETQQQLDVAIHELNKPHA
jgi:acetolactate synthase-1/2/3 large subunit